MDEFNSKKVLVFGLGLLGGGVATTNWLIKHGAHVTVTDMKDENYLEPSLRRLNSPAGLAGASKLKFRLNGHDRKDIEDNEIIVFNPDVSINNPFVKYARKIGRQAENEATIFYKLCPRPIIAITGTRGKTTTASWIGHFLNPVRGLARAKGASPKDLGEATSNGVNTEYRTVVSGNSYVEPLLKTLDRASRFDYVVNEVPSYHLEYFNSDIPAPQVAVITNLYQDHLNRHGTMQEYALAKAAVFKNQSTSQHLVLNNDDKWTPFFLKQKPLAGIWLFSAKPLPKKARGIFYKNGRVYFQDGADPSPVLRIDNFVKEKGGHNLYNSLASSLAANIVGVSWKAIQRSVQSLPQIQFRQETIFKNSRLRIVNDTTATSPDGGMAAIARFGGPFTVLIAGGTDRDLDYRRWGITVRRRVKPQNLILLDGSAVPKMVKAVGVAGKKAQIFDTLQECIKKALVLAGQHPKSVVLFSPAAKSFEKFQNEFDRGKRFNVLIKKEVRKWTRR